MKNSRPAENHLIGWRQQQRRMGWPCLPSFSHCLRYGQQSLINHGQIIILQANGQLSFPKRSPSIRPSTIKPSSTAAAVAMARGQGRPAWGLRRGIRCCCGYHRCSCCSRTFLDSVKDSSSTYCSSSADVVQGVRKRVFCGVWCGSCIVQLLCVLLCHIQSPLILLPLFLAT